MENRLVSPPFMVRTAGVVENWPYHSTHGTKNGDYMLTVFMGGKGSYRNSQGAVTVGFGMAGIVPPRDEGILMADPDDPYYHYYCRFRGGYAVYLADRILSDRGRRFFPVSDAEGIAASIRLMGRIQRINLPVDMGRAEALLARMLVDLGAAGEERAPVYISNETIRHYLDERISMPTDLSAMARDFAVSKPTLCRMVKKHCNATVQRLHESMKMAWACTLLSAGRLNVNEVALRVGYDDPAYFCRVFKRRQGVSPGRWRGRSDTVDQHPLKLY